LWIAIVMVVRIPLLLGAKKRTRRAELTSLSAILLATKPAADNKANNKQINKLLQVLLAVKLLHLFAF